MIKRSSGNIDVEKLIKDIIVIVENNIQLINEELTKTKDLANIYKNDNKLQQKKIRETKSDIIKLEQLVLKKSND